MTGDRLAAPTSTGRRFGTFGGVFTPSILTIIGVIMYLRAGYVVGQAGIGSALAILVISSGITLLTAFSIAVIATNTPVGGGGAYFLISRSLGPQFGGSIAVVLYLGQALSVPFYLLGFTNALVQTFPLLTPWFTPIALGMLTVLFVVNLVGAQCAIRSQYFVMAVLGVSILVFLAGGLARFETARFLSNWPPAYTTREATFWSMFALYFPAVTGILSGVNMSGDLRDPSRSLVRGTLAAIGIGFAVYALQIVLCGGSQSRADLVARPYEMLVRNALFGAGFMVVAGVFAATLSSALGSLLGAPRVLQALARDRVLPGIEFLGRGSARGDEPVIPLWLTFMLSVLVIGEASGPDALHAFDRVAAVVAMSFLGTYGIINVAAFVESFGLNPSFRPRFRHFHWSVALLGAVACMGAMLQIDAVAAVVALVIVAVLYAGISRRETRAAFGDARRGFLFTIVSRSLHALRRLQADPKNWRPALLVLCSHAAAGSRLPRYGALLEARRGLVTVARVLTGDLAEMLRHRNAAVAEMESLLARERIQAFAEVAVATDLDEGIKLLIQSHSIGAIKPNTVLLGWPREMARVPPFFRHIRTILSLGRSVVCLLEGRAASNGSNAGNRVDVWCLGGHNPSLMLVLSYLLTRNMEWRGARVRVLMAAAAPQDTTEASAALRHLVEAGRLDATVVVVTMHGTIEETVAAHSADADAVFMGFTPPAAGQEGEVFAARESLRGRLNALFLVCSSGDADLTA